MNKKIFYVFAAVSLLISATGCSLFIKPQPNNGVSGKTVTFNVTAKKFQFDPARLNVIKGDNVVINITSLDATHGFELNEYSINETINQGETKTVRFVADKVGTFIFMCSVPCGSGHSDMKGELIVSEADGSVISTDKNKILDLHGQGLEQISQSVFKMDRLEVLDVSGNKLTGALPGEIRFLKRLKKLDASDNQMTGIPAEIGQLAELEELDYSNNQITGLPLEIGNLKKLKTFNLTGNNYSKIDLAKIKANLPNLKVIGE